MPPLIRRYSKVHVLERNDVQTVIGLRIRIIKLNKATLAEKTRFADETRLSEK